MPARLMIGSAMCWLRWGSKHLQPSWKMYGKVTIPSHSATARSSSSPSAAAVGTFRVPNTKDPPGIERHGKRLPSQRWSELERSASLQLAQHGGWRRGTRLPRAQDCLEGLPHSCEKVDLRHPRASRRSCTKAKHSPFNTVPLVRSTHRGSLAARWKSPLPCAVDLDQPLQVDARMHRSLACDRRSNLAHCGFSVRKSRRSASYWSAEGR